MATLHGRRRNLVQKIQSGSRFLEVHGSKMPVISKEITGANVEAGWGCLLDAQGRAVSTTTNVAMFGMLGPIYQRFVNHEGRVCQPIILRGVAYTHRHFLDNAGDIKGNLMCLGTNGESVDSGGVGDTRNSRIVIIGKRQYTT